MECVKVGIEEPQTPVEVRYTAKRYDLSMKGQIGAVKLGDSLIEGLACVAVNTLLNKSAKCTLLHKSVLY